MFITFLIIQTGCSNGLYTSSNTTSLPTQPSPTQVKETKTVASPPYDNLPTITPNPRAASCSELKSSPFWDIDLQRVDSNQKLIDYLNQSSSFKGFDISSLKNDEGQVVRWVDKGSEIGFHAVFLTTGKRYLVFEQHTQMFIGLGNIIDCFGAPDKYVANETSSSHGRVLSVDLYYLNKNFIANAFGVQGTAFLNERLPVLFITRTPPGDFEFMVDNAYSHSSLGDVALKTAKTWPGQINKIEIERLFN